MNWWIDNNQCVKNCDSAWHVEIRSQEQCYKIQTILPAYKGYCTSIPPSDSSYQPLQNRCGLGLVEYKIIWREDVPQFGLHISTIPNIVYIQNCDNIHYILLYYSTKYYKKYCRSHRTQSWPSEFSVLLLGRQSKTFSASAKECQEELEQITIQLQSQSVPSPQWLEEIAKKLSNSGNAKREERTQGIGCEQLARIATNVWKFELLPSLRAWCLCRLAPKCLPGEQLPSKSSKGLTLSHVSTGLPKSNFGIFQSSVVRYKLLISEPAAFSGGLAFVNWVCQAMNRITINSKPFQKAATFGFFRFMSGPWAENFAKTRGEVLASSRSSLRQLFQISLVSGPSHRAWHDLTCKFVWRLLPKKLSCFACQR